MTRTVSDFRMDRSICYATIKNLSETQQTDILMYLEVLENELLAANPEELSEVVKQYFSELAAYQKKNIEDPEEL